MLLCSTENNPIVTFGYVIKFGSRESGASQKNMYDIPADRREIKKEMHNKCNAV